MVQRACDRRSLISKSCSNVCLCYCCTPKVCMRFTRCSLGSLGFVGPQLVFATAAASQSVPVTLGCCYCCRRCCRRITVNRYFVFAAQRHPANPASVQYSNLFLVGVFDFWDFRGKAVEINGCWAAREMVRPNCNVRSWATRAQAARL